MIKEEEIAELQAENERLKEENEKLNKMTGIFSVRLCKKYRTTLQEIKGYLSTLSGIDNDFVNTETYLRILDLITQAESGE